MSSSFENFDSNTSYDIAELLAASVSDGRMIILISEYQYGLIETKFMIVNDLDDCINFIERRYKYFDKEKTGYRHIEEQYLKDKLCLHLMSHFEEKHTYATNIRIFGISEDQYINIRKTIKKIFGKHLFDLANL